jgi:thiamine-phosphate pyrophosphorylase
MELGLRGLYLVVDPAQPLEELLDKVKIALDNGVNLVQIWNNWPAGISIEEKVDLIASFYELTSYFNRPLLLNENLELEPFIQVDGFHLDTIPNNFDKTNFKKDYLFGITCSNDLEVIKKAKANDMDYISFCAVFPSQSAIDCELVSLETIENARAMTKLPFFVSGGINLKTINKLKAYPIQGVAIISGIMKANDLATTTKSYAQITHIIL